MYLCNIRLTGKELPNSLPEKVRNEVSSMVDIISFGVPDEQPGRPSATNAPSFDQPLNQSSRNVPTIQQPQPQQSNSSLLSSLSSQPTGFGQPPMALQSQLTGFGQAPGYGQPQVGGYTGPRPPMPPMPTGYGSNLTPSQTGMAPLNAQPTGVPGQWGLVNTPATGLPNIEALAQRMMPQTGREAGNYNTSGLSGNATIPWAITKGEKKLYDDTFKAWDGFGKGYIGGEQAIEIMGQSGLPKPDLERIWTLADSSDRGRLNLDEFAVAMHLIYRKLNGYPVPNRLPPELIPPSTRNINDSIGTMKSLLSRDAEERKTTGAFLQPQRTGVSYLKSHSFRAGSPQTGGRKDGTVFRNNDESVGYKSSARRRLGADGRSPSPAASDRSQDEYSIEQLKKMVREKQILLDAMDTRDEDAADEDDALDRRDRRDADDLYRRIRKVQEDIDAHPQASSRSNHSDAERRTLKRQLQKLTDRLPELASNVRRTEREIADAQLELFRLKDAKAHPGSASSIVGTGPGGSITESDRLKARARAMMQARSAALTGKPIPTSDDTGAAAERLEKESSRVRSEKENNERMIRDVEDSVNEYTKGLEASLKEGGNDKTSEHERRRWEDGLGVEDEIKDFIFDLQRSSQSTKVRKQDTSRDRPQASSRTDSQDRPSAASRYESPARSVESPRPAASSATRTPEERTAFIKQQAEQRMAERLAALGLRPPPVKTGESTQQRQEREKKEREDKLRQAEEEDARREEERQRRLNEESTAPPSITKTNGKKAPPPPVSRKNKAEAPQQDNRQADADTKRAENERAESALRQQQEAQEQETSRMEYVYHLSLVVQILITITGMKSAVKKKSSLRSVRLHKPDFVRLRNKSNKARFKSKKRSAEGKLLSVRPKTKKPGLLLSVRRSRQHVSVNGNFSFNWKISMTMILLMMTMAHKTSRLRVQHQQTVKSYPANLHPLRPRQCHHLLFQCHTSTAHHHLLWLALRHLRLPALIPVLGTQKPKIPSSKRWQCPTRRITQLLHHHLHQAIPATSPPTHSIA
jgi:hypothetical protein